MIRSGLGVCVLNFREAGFFYFSNFKYPTCYIFIFNVIILVV